MSARRPPLQPRSLPARRSSGGRSLPSRSYEIPVVQQPLRARGRGRPGETGRAPDLWRRDSAKSARARARVPGHFITYPMKIRKIYFAPRGPFVYREGCKRKVLDSTEGRV